MRSIRLGANNAVRSYLNINQNHRVVVITDMASCSLADCLVKSAKEVTEDVNVLLIEDYGNRFKEFTMDLFSFYENERQKVVSFYLIRKEDERNDISMSGDPVADWIDEDKKGRMGHVKHASLPGITKEIMQQGFCVPYETIKRYSAKVHDRLKDSKLIEIISPGGTELEMNVDSKNIGWVVEDRIGYGCWENIPFGEVYTSPIDCNGRLVVDCLVGGYEEYGFGFLRRYPVSFKIEKGKVKEILCRRATKLVSSLVKEMFKSDRAANNIGEVGFGTNIGLKGFIGNALQDEKFPGVHIGIGAAMPYCGKRWNSCNHTDLLMLEPTVYVDGRLLMKDGRYVFNGNGGLK